MGRAKGVEPQVPASTRLRLEHGNHPRRVPEIHVAGAALESDHHPFQRRLAADRSNSVEDPGMVRVRSVYNLVRELRSVLRRRAAVHLHQEPFQQQNAAALPSVVGALK